jgi:phage shock protein A
MPDTLYSEFSAIRENYRRLMNKATDRAQTAAANEDMDECSKSSTEAERYREVFHALNQMQPIIERAESRLRAAVEKFNSHIDVALADANS